MPPFLTRLEPDVDAPSCLVAACEALAKAGAEWTFENNYGHTALTLLCKDGNDKMVRELQRLEVPMDQETTFGNTALMQAVTSKQMQLIPVRLPKK
eukprot:1177211-Prorocentrum_minimum.AAC.1